MNAFRNLCEANKRSDNLEWTKKIYFYLKNLIFEYFFSFKGIFLREKKYTCYFIMQMARLNFTNIILKSKRDFFLLKMKTHFKASKKDFINLI